MPGAAPSPGRIIYCGSCWASKLPPRRSLARQQERRLPALDGATHVYVQRGSVGPPLADNLAGPFLVLEKGLKVFKFQLGTRQEVVSWDWLKPHVGMAPPAVAEPPRRGHPPRRRE